MKFYAYKLLDLLLIAALVFGSKTVSTFALILIGVMIVFCVVGAIFLDEQTALKLSEQSLLKKSVRWAVWIAYPAGLLYVDHPAWAATYVIALGLIFAAVSHRLKGAA